jgi:hypothetical protein
MHLTSRRHSPRSAHRQARFFQCWPQIRQKGGHRPPFCPCSGFRAQRHRSGVSIASDRKTSVTSPRLPVRNAAKEVSAAKKMRKARRPAPGRQSQPFVRLNGALPRRRCRPTEAAAYGLLAPLPHAGTPGASVPVGDRGVAPGSACGSDCHETRRQPRALRLLGGEARNPSGTGTHRHRAGRHSRPAG